MLCWAITNNYRLYLLLDVKYIIGIYCAYDELQRPQKIPSFLEKKSKHHVVCYFSIMSGAFRAISIRRGSKFCTIWRYWRVQISILKPDSATNHVKHISEKCTGLLRPGPCWAWAGLPQPTLVAFFLQPPPAATLFFAPVQQCSSDSI